MTPTYLNSSSPNSHFHHDLKQDQNHHLLLTTPNPSYNSSSPPSSSLHIFFNSTSTRDNYYKHHQAEGDNFATNGGSYEINNESDHSGLKFSIWKDESKNENQSETTNIHQVKWMSSKMRLMHKMKRTDRTVVNAPITTTFKFEDDHKQLPSPRTENDNSSANSSSNNSPIRVCSDCNTTKTPLWRSGPRGPKSLCNACGIRQRKARRAMAAVEAPATGTNTTNVQSDTSMVKITKALHKDKRSNVHKRCKISVPPSPSSQGKEKLCFEDFFTSLSKNLAFHRVFPQDEKEAAILLMALSCGHVHG